jgi:tRNA nucleotidyltransferase (CCA-adding enzyme)
MPRREKATGRGHRDFEIEVDPFIGTYKAARRRDFTINALMQDVLTGEVVDHFGGMDDLRAGIIRHIDPETFIEDPLRVLRGAQFAARFGFRIAPETVELCKGIDLSALSRERIEEELKKALLKSDKPSVFFEEMRRMEQLDVWFPELGQTIGLEQDPVFHPEGDVWVHTMEVIDRAAAVRDKT